MRGLPNNAVARVNESLISIERFERVVALATRDSGSEPNSDQRERILRQLVEEELLVQRGTELGLEQSEATVRAAIVQSMVASVTAEADAADPSDDELEQFVSEHAEDYTYASATRVMAWVTDDELLAQDHAARVRETLGADADLPDGVREVPGLPSAALPPERLRMFLGPAIAAATLEMPERSTAIFARQGRWYVVHVAAHEAESRADLSAVRSQALIDYRRALAQDALRDYLDGLLQRADVTMVAP